jgi:hypothetical protein
MYIMTMMNDLNASCVFSNNFLPQFRIFLFSVQPYRTPRIRQITIVTGCIMGLDEFKHGTK